MGNLQFPIRNPCSNAHSGRQVAGIVPTWNSSGTNTQAAWQTEPWKQMGWLPQFCRTHYITGWWYTYTSEKWLSSSVGSMTFPIYGKNDVPNHLPDKHDRNEILFFTTGFTPRIPLVFHITCCNPTVTQQKNMAIFIFSFGLQQADGLAPCLLARASRSWQWPSDPSWDWLYRIIFTLW